MDTAPSGVVYVAYGDGLVYAFDHIALTLTPLTLTPVPGVRIFGAFGLRVDQLTGIIYAADPGANVIWAIDPSALTFGVFAGSFNVPGPATTGVAATSATLSSPYGVAMSGALVYIADYGNHVIRVVDKGTSLIYTVAGTGVADFNGDGPALQTTVQPFSLIIEPGSGAVIFSDYNRVRRLYNGVVTTIAGAPV